MVGGVGDDFNQILIFLYLGVDNFRQIILLFGLSHDYRSSRCYMDTFKLVVSHLPVPSCASLMVWSCPAMF